MARNEKFLNILLVQKIFNLLNFILVSFHTGQKRCLKPNARQDAVRECKKSITCVTKYLKTLKKVWIRDTAILIELPT